MKFAAVVGLGLTIGIVRTSLAVAPDDYLTLGLRVGAHIAQRKLASPPLPSLDKNNNNHLSVQLGYITGKINGKFDAPAAPPEQGYTGKPLGYAVGLAYTSPSSGSFSYYAFGIHSQSKSDIDITFPGSTTLSATINNSATTADAISMGLNYVLLGDVKSPFAVGLFGGGYMVFARTNYDFLYANPPVGTSNSHLVSSKTINYGPATGLQMKIRFGKVFLISHAIYALDVTDHCMDLTIDSATYLCSNHINNTFRSIGTSLGYWRFSISLYATIWSNIEGADIKMRKYNIGYSFPF